MSETSVKYNRALTDNLYLMGLDWSGDKSVKPGQFIMLKISDGYDPLLRRPFGIYGLVTDGAGSTLEIVYKVVGKGTTIMSTLTAGDKLDIMAPIGNGFPEIKEGKELVMVAGGIGIAPFKLLAAGYPDSVLLFGARDASETVLVNEIKDLGIRVKVATIDGSIGMLKAVSKLSHESKVQSFVSLERAMACGVGACLGCAVKTKGHGHGNQSHEDAEFEKLKMVCSDGPVFDGELIDWDLL
jgi:dihydroorotate dehydrogenase electron transfer subunit